MWVENLSVFGLLKVRFFMDTFLKQKTHSDVYSEFLFLFYFSHNHLLKWQNVIYEEIKCGIL